MKISIDEEKCIKCGLCSSICPDVFVFNEEGTKVVKKDETLNTENNKKLAEDIDTAKTNCPNRAITVEGELTK